MVAAELVINNHEIDITTSAGPMMRAKFYCLCGKNGVEFKKSTFRKNNAVRRVLTRLPLVPHIWDGKLDQHWFK